VADRVGDERAGTVAVAGSRVAVACVGVAGMRVAVGAGGVGVAVAEAGVAVAGRVSVGLGVAVPMGCAVAVGAGRVSVGLGVAVASGAVLVAGICGAVAVGDDSNGRIAVAALSVAGDGVTDGVAPHPVTPTTRTARKTRRLITNVTPRSLWSLR